MTMRATQSNVIKNLTTTAAQFELDLSLLCHWRTGSGPDPWADSAWIALGKSDANKKTFSIQLELVHSTPPHPTPPCLLPPWKAAISAVGCRLYPHPVMDAQMTVLRAEQHDWSPPTYRGLLRCGLKHAVQRLLGCLISICKHLPKRKEINILRLTEIAALPSTLSVGSLGVRHLSQKQNWTLFKTSSQLTADRDLSLPMQVPFWLAKKVMWPVKSFQ